MQCIGGLARQEEVLRDSLARAAVSGVLYAWYPPHPHIIPAHHCPGYPEPSLFLEEALARNPGTEEGAPLPRQPLPP